MTPAALIGIGVLVVIAAWVLLRSSGQGESKSRTALEPKKEKSPIALLDEGTSPLNNEEAREWLNELLEKQQSGK